MKLFNQNELQTISNILTPYGVFEKMWGENDMLNALSVPVFLAIKKDSHSTPSLLNHTYGGVTSFPKLQMALKGRKFNTAVIQAKSRDALA
jgi:hypothetical protein